MARKGSQQRNGVDRHASNHKKKTADSGSAVKEIKGRGKGSEVKVFPGDELPNGDQPCSPSRDGERRTYHAGDGKKNKQKSEKFERKEKQEIDGVQDPGESVSLGKDSSGPVNEAPATREENESSPSSDSASKHMESGLHYLPNGSPMKDMMDKIVVSGIVMIGNLRSSALSMLKVTGEWLEKQRPLIVSLTTSICHARDCLKSQMQKAYPVVLKWLMQFGSIMLLLSMLWLDCALRGIDSFLRMGTTSLVSVIWCSILSVIAMVGMFKFLIVLAIAAFVGAFTGLTIGLLLLAFSGTAFLWFYGSFWTTTFVILMGGFAFMLSHERAMLLITTVYAIYCAWTYTGWLGLLVALNLSFISSDILMYFLKNNINQQRRSSIPPDQSTGVKDRPSSVDDESFNASSSETGPGLSADRTSGVPSTSGADCELTSEEEVIRLLNCTDHYSVLGLSRYENVDVSFLKKEYRKKAMLVHPDKNMGNERAADAFKKLQNAYEILLDSVKRKAYDDELRREELLNYFRRFQSTSQKNGEHRFSASGFACSDADGEDLFGESRRIACKKCGNFHFWAYSKKSKSQARWCQDCKDFHQAKDGDGWVEQSSHPFFFGLLQKVDIPLAYVCADGKVYNATEWYICQGMRCPANTHKPSFHVNTSVTSKHNASKGTSSGQRNGRVPPSNMDETMTEEEFFEWLQNAVQAGMFDDFNGGAPAESSSARAGNGPKSGGSSTGGGGKKKKRGKKQW